MFLRVNLTLYIEIKMAERDDRRRDLQQKNLSQIFSKMVTFMLGEIDDFLTFIIKPT